MDLTADDLQASILQVIKNLNQILTKLQTSAT